MVQHITEGIWVAKDSLLIGAGLFLLCQITLVVIKRRNLKDYASISKINLVAEYLLATYICTILRITGIIRQDSYFSFSPSNLLGFLSIPFAGSSIMMITLNFLLFVPYGFLVSYIFRNRKWTIKHALIIGAVSSFCIEVAQAFTGRMTEIDDLLINTAGFTAGFLLWNALEEMLGRHQIKKGILQATGILVVSVAGLFLLSFVANGDAIQAARDRYYNGIAGQLGTLDEELASISSMHIIHKGEAYIIQDTETLDAKGLYEEVGLDITTFSSQYAQSEEKTNAKSVIKESADYYEVTFSSPQTFRFYNNQNWVMENVCYILYCLDNGELWYGESADNLSYHVSVMGKDYGFQKNESLQEYVKEITSH